MLTCENTASQFTIIFNKNDVHFLQKNVIYVRFGQKQHIFFTYTPRGYDQTCSQYTLFMC